MGWVCRSREGRPLVLRAPCRAPFPRGERHDRSAGGEKSRGKVAGSASCRLRVIAPGYGGLPANRGRARRRFRLPSGGRRGPPGVEAGPRADCCTVCSGCRAAALWVRSREEAQGQWRVGRHPLRPVLKHGPRSLTCARAAGPYETRGRNESEGRRRTSEAGSPPPSRARGALPARLCRRVDEAEQERTRWDPKDGELCLSRTKSGETLMEVRSDSDVQIDRQTWV